MLAENRFQEKKLFFTDFKHTPLKRAIKW